MDLGRSLFVFSLLIILSLLAGGSSAARDTGRSPEIIGGYSPIKNLSDPYVVGIAKFAVSQHNKDASDDLVFVNILSGQEQVVAGTNYKLVIAAKHGAAGANAAGGKYQAVVWDKPWEKFRQLTSFGNA